MCTDCVVFIKNCMEFRRKCKDAEASLLHVTKQMTHNKNLKKKSLLHFENVAQEQGLNIDEDDRPLKHFIDRTDSVSSKDLEPNNDLNIETVLEETYDDHIQHESVIEHDVSTRTIVKEDCVSIIGENLTTTLELNNINEANPERKTIMSKDDSQEPLYELVDSDTIKQRVLCKLCHKELSLRSFVSHVARRHPGADRRAKCELCDRYVTAAKMNRHVVLVHGSGPFKCGYCKREHASREALLEHAGACADRKKKRKPSQTSRALQQCAVCHKTMQRASLRAHTRVQHAGLGPVCEHCGLRFSNKLRLLEHGRAKHGHHKLQCSFCDFQSAGVVALRNHERRHRGEKPFVCETCGAKFHAAYLLAQHRHSHRTEKLVKCEQCPAAFKASNNLHTHRLACHGARARCELCGRDYGGRLYAARHRRRAHAPPPADLL
ncbi:zinc finger protein 626 isoform X2 [Amyelois transitella]|nr:zinc finger protein 626 isoform X2 [Amyelois transitella]